MEGYMLFLDSKAWFFRDVSIPKLNMIPVKNTTVCKNYFLEPDILIISTNMHTLSEKEQYWWGCVEYPPVVILSKTVATKTVWNCSERWMNRRESRNYSDYIKKLVCAKDAMIWVKKKDFLVSGIKTKKIYSRWI